MSPFLAEYIATAVMIVLGNGSVANVVTRDTKGAASGWIVITTGWALAVFVAVIIAGPYSGAHLNPAVTLGLALAGNFPWQDLLPYALCQMAGAFTGAVLVWIFYHDHIERTDDKATLQALFCTAPAIRNTPINFFSEFLATFILILGVLYITGAEIIDTTTPIGLGSVGAIPIAFVVWVLGLALGGTTGYAINPARDLGPRIAHSMLPMKYKGDSGWGYSWIPVLAPLTGAAAAALLFMLSK